MINSIRRENLAHSLSSTFDSAKQCLEPIKSVAANAFNSLANAINDKVEQISDWINRKWEYFTQSPMLVGLATSTLATIAVNYFLECTNLKTAAVFGMMSYIFLTPLWETTRTYSAIDPFKAVSLVGVSGALATKCAQFACGAFLGYQAIAILSAAAFVGQVVRTYLMQDDFVSSDNPFWRSF